MHDDVFVNGKVQLYLNDSLIAESTNTVVTSGLSNIASILVSGTSYAGKYIQIGTGATAVTLPDINLQNAQGVRTLGVLTQSGNSFILESVMPQNSPSSQILVTEAGIFTTVTGGTMIARLTFPGVIKQTTDTMRIVWTVTLS